MFINNRHSKRGFSFVEVMLSAILLAALFTAGMALFGNLGRASQDTIDQDLAAELCLEMIKEIKVLPYADPQSSDTGIAFEEAGANRELFDDIDDYDGWSATPPRTRKGVELNRYQGLTRTVMVDHVNPGNFQQMLSDTDDQGIKRITIIIKRSDQEIARQVYIIPNIPDDMLEPQN
jgi:Tfp pilus assembly protein PilV